jgi:hypothetical protein
MHAATPPHEPDAEGLIVRIAPKSCTSGRQLSRPPRHILSRHQASVGVRSEIRCRTGERAPCKHESSAIAHTAPADAAPAAVQMWYSATLALDCTSRGPSRDE